MQLIVLPSLVTCVGMCRRAISGINYSMSRLYQHVKLLHNGLHAGVIPQLYQGVLNPYIIIFYAHQDNEDI